jgi:hypothetical protein
MTNKEFETMLKSTGLTKKEFAHQVKMSYGSVVNWGRAHQSVPDWVESWLDLYLNNKKFEELKKSIKESGACS